MSKNRTQKDARIVQDATGAAYTVCLTHLRSFGADRAGYEAFMARVDAIPDGREGTEEHPLCVRCLGQHGGRCSS